MFTVAIAFLCNVHTPSRIIANILTTPLNSDSSNFVEFEKQNLWSQYQHVAIVKGNVQLNEENFYYEHFEEFSIKQVFFFHLKMEETISFHLSKESSSFIILLQRFFSFLLPPCMHCKGHEKWYSILRFPIKSFSLSTWARIPFIIIGIWLVKDLEHKLISKYKLIICVLINYNFRF